MHSSGDHESPFLAIFMSLFLAAVTIIIFRQYHYDPGPDRVQQVVECEVTNLKAGYEGFWFGVELADNAVFALLHKGATKFVGEKEQTCPAALTKAELDRLSADQGYLYLKRQEAEQMTFYMTH